MNFPKRTAVALADFTSGRRLHRWRQFASGFLPVLLLGCSTLPMTPGAVRADNHTFDENGQLMYELMIAELAGRRGYLDVATEGYLRAAERTGDVRVSARAAQLAVYSRQWDKAEKAIKRWLELAPEAIEPHEMLATVMLRTQQPELATEQFAILIEANPEERNLIMREVVGVLAREPDPEQAIVVMRALKTRFPDLVESHLGLSRLYLQRNDREQALAAANDALAIDSQAHDALLIKAQILSAMGRPTEGFDELREALELDEDNVQLRLGYAQLLVDAGRYGDASSQLDILYSLAPDNGNVLLTIGLLALDSKRIEAASTYLTSLLELGEHSDQAHFYLARISDQQQEYEQAIEHYSAIQPGDMFVTAQVRAAELHAAIGELDTGLELLHELAIVLPDPSLKPQLLTAEGRMLQEAGRAIDAVAVLTQGLEQFPDNGELLYARALAADNAGDSAMLQADLGRLIETEPDNAHALNALGYFLADANVRLDEAEVYLEKANALKPNDAAIIDSLGWLRYRQGKLAPAVTLLRQAYELYADTEIAAHLGEVLWASGEQEAARDLWEKALLESPDDDILLKVVKRFTE